MPSNQGTSRKGKPGKHERAVGLGKALTRAQRQQGPRKPRNGMELQPNVRSIGLDELETNTKSVLELQSIDDFLLQAELANREFHSEREGLVVIDAASQPYRGVPTVKWADQKPAFAFQELSVPRRPTWDETTTRDELISREKEAFLEWRRAIAAKEEELINVAKVTPFEKNLEVWRQLWRVLERSSCLLQLVDARNPLFYLSDDLRNYAQELGKPMMVLVNKADFLSTKQRQAWSKYLSEKGWEVVFFSAVLEQEKLDKAAQAQKKEEQQSMHEVLVQSDEPQEEDEDDDDQGDPSMSLDSDGQKQPSPNDESGVNTPLLTRQQLMDAMMEFALKHDCQPDPHYENRIQFGMVGFPNVGKSSVINVLVGSSKHAHGVVRVGVASQPGKTKHFQTLLLPDRDDMMLCDCPGLVFPSFVSNTADLIAAGVYPIAQMRDHWPVIGLICQRIPREIINAHYGIQLPVPTEWQMRENGFTEVPPPTAEEFLTTFCVARGMLAASSGVPDYPRAARIVIKDYAVGKLLYCHPPPDFEDTSKFYRETVLTALYNTSKLREKLLRHEEKHIAAQRPDGDPRDGGGDHAFNLMEVIPEISTKLPGQSLQKKGQFGKKGRQKKAHRHKDPYGCHSTPDDILDGAVASSGVLVKAGKYSRSDYTRPTTYAGARSAPAVVSTDKS